MLEQYLKPYAKSLDEVNYRVHFKARQEYDANKEYRDGDYWEAPWFAHYWRRVFASKLHTAGITVNDQTRVLDMCCGRGDLGIFLQEYFGAQVTFSDLSWLQLQSLDSRLVSNDTFSPSICAADVLKLPFQPASFNLVIGNSFLHHLPDVPSALAELRRVQAPDGATVLLHEPSLSANYWQSFPLSLVKDTTLVSGPATDLWMFTPDDLCRLFLQVGYKHVNVMGTGVLSSVVVNWYLLLALKLNWRSNLGIYPAYILRAWMDGVERSVQKWNSHSPSLMVVAKG